MVGFAGNDGESAVNLLQKKGPDHLMGVGEFAEGKPQIGFPYDFLV